MSEVSQERLMEEGFAGDVRVMSSGFFWQQQMSHCSKNFVIL